MGRSSFFRSRGALVCAASGLQACPLWPDLLLAGGPVEQQVAGSCMRLLLRPWAKWASCSGSPWPHTALAGSASCCPHPHGASWWPPSFEPAGVHPLGFCVQSWHGGCTSPPPLSITFPRDLATLPGPLTYHFSHKLLASPCFCTRRHVKRWTLNPDRKPASPAHPEQVCTVSRAFGCFSRADSWGLQCRAGEDAEGGRRGRGRGRGCACSLSTDEPFYHPRLSLASAQNVCRGLPSWQEKAQPPRCATHMSLPAAPLSSPRVPPVPTSCSRLAASLCQAILGHAFSCHRALSHTVPMCWGPPDSHFPSTGRLIGELWRGTPTEVRGEGKCRAGAGAQGAAAGPSPPLGPEAQGLEKACLLSFEDQAEVPSRGETQG